MDWATMQVVRTRKGLDQIIELQHELVQLTGKIEWDWLDGEIARE